MGKSFVDIHIVCVNITSFSEPSLIHPACINCLLSLFNTEFFIHSQVIIQSGSFFIFQEGLLNNV